MTQLTRSARLVIVLALLLLAWVSTASAECAWVLWDFGLAPATNQDAAL
jgi:hypothetical protein